MLLGLEEAILRLFASFFLSGLIGLEREFTQKSAGLRTHILVSMGSCIFTLISVSSLLSHGVIPLEPLPEGVHITINQDPGRIAAQVVTGIGFIGGGALLRYGTSIRGVTTAASLWTAAAIGMLCATGAYELSAVATLLTLFTLMIVGKIEHIGIRKNPKQMDRMRLLVTVEAKALEAVRAWIENRFRADVLESKVDPDEVDGSLHLHYVIHLRGRRQDWRKWRAKLEKKHGVLATGIQFYESTTQWPAKDRQRS